MTPRTRLSPALPLVLALALGAAAPCLAAGKEHDREPRNPDYAAAVAEVERGAFADAVPYLQRAAEARPRDAGVYNLLGFTHRKAGKPIAAEIFYREALRLDPEHKRAHAHLGDLYLQRGDVAAAEAQLAALNDLCPLPCAEQRALANSIESHRENLASSD